MHSEKAAKIGRNLQSSFEIKLKCQKRVPTEMHRIAPSCNELHRVVEPHYSYSYKVNLPKYSVRPKSPFWFRLDTKTQTENWL